MTEDLFTLGAGVLIFVITLLLGLLPYKKKGIMKPKLWLRLLNSFTGGMFLALGLVHILPEAQNEF